MASGYTVSALTDYVKTNQDVLIKNVVLGGVKGDTIPRLRKQFGIKTKERLNYLDVDPSIQDGSNCGFNPSGSTVFSERDIETAQLKAQDQYCDKDLLGKYAEYLVKINAQKDGSDMPFEREILDEVVGKINEKMEKLVWQGATTAHSGTDLIDGFLTQALNSDSASTVNVAIASGTSVYNAIKAVVMAIPEQIIDNATIFVAPAIYRAFVQEMVEKNYIHFGPDGKVEGDSITFPGSDIAVKKTLGLTGDKKHIYASVYANMVYGADLEGDNEKVRFWYDDNSELFKYSIHWNSGVKTLYPDMVVLGTGAADLV
jgi:hypothetical protein